MNNGGNNMSKIVKATCTIREAEPDILEKAMELFAKHSNAELEYLRDERIKVSSDHPVNWMHAIIGIKEGQIEIECDDYFMSHAREIIEQYYVATDIAEEYDAEPTLNEQGELVMELEVM
jgi:hypothetical protein